MILKIGHRGVMGHEPENTLRSFAKALELNVDMIELDVYVCRSGELVVIHDDKVDRTTHGHGYVIEMSFDELRQLDAGKGEKIPTLSEVLDLVNRQAKVNIELKGPGTAKPVYKLLKDYIDTKGWQHDDFLISSFNHYELQRMKDMDAEFKIGALITGIPIGYAAFAEKLNAYSVNLCIEFINEEFVQDAHQRGFKVFVWTVNDQDDIERVKELGIDGIFSNYPDRL